MKVISFALLCLNFIILNKYFFFKELIKFDKEFYDLDQTETKILNRFAENTHQHTTVSTDALSNQEDLLGRKQLILIHTPTHCSSLQANITLLILLRIKEKENTTNLIYC